MKTNLFRNIFTFMIFTAFAVGSFFSLKFNAHSFFWLLSGMLCLLIANYVCFQDPLRGTNITISVFIFFLALWNFFYFGLFIVQNEGSAITWGRIFAVGKLFTVPAFFHCVLKLTGDKRNRMLLFAGYIYSAIFLLLAWKGLIFENYSKINLLFIPTLGLVWKIWIINPILLLVFSMLTLRSYFKDQRSFKNSWNLVIILLIFSLGIIAIAFESVLILEVFKIYPLGGVVTLIVISFIVHVFLRDNDIHEIRFIRNVLRYLYLCVGVAVVYAVVVWLMLSLVGYDLEANSNMYSGFVGGMAVALMIILFRERIGKVVDFIVFRMRDYDKNILSDFFLKFPVSPS